MRSEQRPGWVDLHAIDDGRWRDARLPGSNLDVALVRLHRDEVTGASVSLARFPPGWARAEAGCFPAAEEMTVLDGALELSGHRFAAGDYGFVPPRVVRTASSSDVGALVLAWFSAAAPWSTDPVDRRAGEITCRPLEVGPLRPPTPDVSGTCAIAASTDLQQAVADRDLLELEGHRWCFATAGAGVPEQAGSGPVQQRTW